MEQIPPISRREAALRGVERVQRVRLLSPEEREEARREREEARRDRERERSEREHAQDRPGGADYRA